MTDALLGYGSRFAIDDEDSPTNYVEIAEVRSITPPSETIDMIDATHMQSPDRRREFISGLIDGGEASFEMNFIPGNASDQRLNVILNLAAGVSRRRSCKITYPNGVYQIFDGELTGYEKTVPFDDRMGATVTFKVTGAVTTFVT
jgi:hypothetical protein